MGWIRGISRAATPRCGAASNYHRGMAASLLIGREAQIAAVHDSIEAAADGGEAAC